MIERIEGCYLFTSPPSASTPMRGVATFFATNSFRNAIACSIVSNINAFLLCGVFMVFDVEIKENYNYASIECNNRRRSINDACFCRTNFRIFKNNNNIQQKYILKNLQDDLQQNPNNLLLFIVNLKINRK